ncbi:polysaccharide deacetylase family protein [Natronorarus salvus]|uniref:polysaccharide deacetylase family protein n=1 Tax=Natronorarus salvus TaxID=3117733 RepID=UPI002F260217
MPTTNVHRRTLLAAVALGLAGCADLGGDDGEEEPEPDDERSDDESDDEEEDVDTEESETDQEDEVESGGEDAPLIDFRDLEQWELMAGELMPDREHYVTGELSANLNVDSGTEWARLERQGLGLDMTGSMPNVVCTIEAPDSMDQAIDVLLEDTGGNRMRLRARIRDTAEDAPFRSYDLGINDWNEEGSVDRTAIDSLRIQSQFNGGESGRVWVDSIDLQPLPETPLIMIQWDDGFESQYTEALPIQEDYDIPSNTFINTVNVGSNGRLTLDQLGELQDAGWEVSSHMMRHDSLLDLGPEEQEVQIRSAQEWLVGNGFETGADYFAYTYGEYDRSGYELVTEYHSLAMIGGEPSYGMPTNRGHVGRSGERTFEEARAYVDTLVEWGGIGALFWHRIPDETPHNEFESIMNYIDGRRDDGELEVITLSQLDELMGED